MPWEKSDGMNLGTQGRIDGTTMTDGKWCPRKGMAFRRGMRGLLPVAAGLLGAVAIVAAPGASAGAPSQAAGQIAVYAAAPATAPDASGAVGSTRIFAGPELLSVSLLATAATAAASVGALESDLGAALHRLAQAGVATRDVKIAPPTLDGTAQPGMVETGVTLTVREPSLASAARLLDVAHVTTWPGENGFYVVGDSAGGPTVAAVTQGAVAALEQATRVAQGIARAQGVSLGPRLSETVFPPSVAANLFGGATGAGVGGAGSGTDVVVRVVFATRALP